MEIVLFIALIIAILSLITIKKQEYLRGARFSKRRYYKKNSSREYLEKVKEATKKRFEEESKNQEYKNNIKNNYL